MRLDRISRRLAGEAPAYLSHFFAAIAADARRPRTTIPPSCEETGSDRAFGGDQPLRGPERYEPPCRSLPMSLLPGHH